MEQKWLLPDLTVQLFEVFILMHFMRHLLCYYLNTKSIRGVEIDCGEFWKSCQEVNE